MVTLSGGAFGGVQVDASDIVIDGIFSHEDSLYRKVSDEQAVFVGLA